ncbi:MAG: hypothetical protein QOK45_182, partial [Mycobacterium sp.]|nr:hypothetical protein [Mycobacterium sp.]
MSPTRRRLSPYERALESFGRSPAGNWYLRRIAPCIDPPMLRLSGGRVSSVYPTPVMLLTTKGAKSGQPRTLPLLYLTDGERLILMASNYGKTSHPAWSRNLTANPSVEVLAGKRSERTRRARSRTRPSVTVPGGSRSTSTPAMAITR